MIDTYPRTRSETRYIRAAICPTCGAPHAIYTPSDRMHASLGHVMADGVTLGRISPRGYRAVYDGWHHVGPRRATRAEANADACARIIAGKAPRPTTATTIAPNGDTHTTDTLARVESWIIRQALTEGKQP